MSIERGKLAVAAQRRPPRYTLPVLVFGLLFASNAFAYLDPGTGSVLLQGSIAATAAIVTWASISWRRMKSWCRAMLGTPGRDGGGRGGNGR